MQENNINKVYCIYLHINKINGKIYVGQTSNLKERWKGSGKNYSGCIKFFRAIKKYGWNNFIHKVIYNNLSKDEADRIEKSLIEILDTIKNGYNIKEGGSDGKLPKESLMKMGNSLRRGYKEHPERKEKIRKKALGRVISKETKYKMSLGKRSFLITINGETGSLRYWAKKIHMSHTPLIYRKNKYGIQNLTSFIEKKLSNW